MGNLDLSDPKVRDELEERVKQVQGEIYDSMIKPIEESRRLTEKDYMITINSPPLKYNSR